MIDDKFFNRLKRETSASHKGLERTYPFSTLMRVDRFDKLSYQRVLLTMTAFHQALHLFEPGVHQQTLSALLNAKEALTALHKDLTILSSDRHELSPLAVTTAKDDTHALMAYAYVWAGSSMGAQILIKWLSKQNALALPTHYYDQMATQSANWQKTKRYISVCLEQETLQPDLLIKEANNWFNAIMQHAAGSYTSDQREVTIHPETL